MELTFSELSKTSLRMPASDKDPLIIAIPCYAEEDPGLILSSLDECENPGMAVVVILLINSPENPTSEVFSLNQKAREYALQHSFSNLVVVPLHITHIPTRIAGVGLARKLAMDLAARWYSESGLGDRPILCCDMDCRVEKNYLVALDAFFKHRPTVDAVSIYFEHPVHEQQDELLRNAIIEYEIHLRYLISGQRWAGHPHAFHTVGSSMAVRAAGYLEQGGMNRRKAGEDFYFLHKFSRVGKLADCQDTTVFPAPRISDRVPFGTGRALLEISEGRRWETIAPNAFLDLKSVIDRLKNSFGLEPGQLINQCPESFQTYSEDSGFVNNFIRIRSNSASPATFLKNLFQWFDAFRVMKYTHHCRDHYYPNQSVESAVNDFFQWAYGKKPALSGEKLLEFMRREEKSALNP